MIFWFLSPRKLKLETCMWESAPSVALYSLVSILLCSPSHKKSG